MEIFLDDEDAYTAWVLAHQGEGFVINAPRRPGSGGLMLHTAACSHIAPAAGWHYTGPDWYKIAATDRAKLAAWAQSQRGPLALCKDCTP
jgi:hypothetical protein